MAGITLSDAEAHLAAWLQASLDIANRGQSAAIKGRALTRAATAEVQNMVQFWDGQCKSLGGGGIKMTRGTPTDDG